MKLTANILPTITRNQLFEADNNVVMFQNSGNVKVVIDNGWTMLPGSVLSVGSQEIVHEIKQSFRIQFVGTSLNDLPDDKRLEVLVMDVQNCD